MKNSKHIYFLFLWVFLIQSLGHASQIPLSQLHEKKLEGDSNKITFQQNNTGKTSTIYAEQKVKVWIGKRVVRGFFKKTEGDNMVLYMRIFKD